MVVPLSTIPRHVRKLTFTRVFRVVAVLFVIGKAELLLFFVVVEIVSSCGTRIDVNKDKALWPWAASRTGARSSGSTWKHA